VGQKTFYDQENFNSVLSSGSEADILEFIRRKDINNPEVFKWKDIYWLLRKKSFYESMIQILRERKIYHEQVWAFGVYHRDSKIVN